MNTYIIGDVHGCYATLKKLLEEHCRIQPQDELIFVGDLIDRGPGSKAVIDYVWHLQNHIAKLTVLRGNHEQMLLDAYADTNKEDFWLQNGGLQTLQSFGVKQTVHLPPEYIKFLAQLPFYLETSEYWVVHAGFNTAAQNWLSDTNAMMWERNWEYRADVLKNKPVFHGHTPVKLHDVLNAKGSWVVNLDAGCVYHRYEGKGYLVAWCPQQQTFFSAEYCD